MATLQANLRVKVVLQYLWEGVRETLNTRIYKHVPQIMDHLLDLLHHRQELSTTLLVHDIRVPSFNRGSVKDNAGVIWQSSRLNDSSGPVVYEVGEMPSYSADSI